MNIYSLNTIKKKYIFDTATYMVQSNLHTESFVCKYKNPIEPSDCGEIAFIQNSVLLQSWMTLLDMNDFNSISSHVAFQKLKTLTELLHIDSLSFSNFSEYLETLDMKTYLDTITQSLDLLKEILELRPALGYLYPSIYKSIVCFYEYVEENVSISDTIKKIENIAKILNDEINSLSSEYNSAQEYINRTFILPYQKKLKVPAYQIMLLYQQFCLHYKYDNFGSKSIKTGNFKQPTEQAWMECMDTNIPATIDEPIVSYSISSIHDFLQAGTTIMLQNDLTLRKCQNCGGYFCVKYTSNQDYCNRSFSNASTCSEYAARKSYKDRLFENPINTEYTKSYNKLYARIRRKKLPADTPLKEELLKLRNEYMERYEHTHQKDREAVWKEYIKKNKELLK